MTQKIDIKPTNNELSTVITAIKRRIILIAAITFSALILSGIIVSKLTPQYEATAVMQIDMRKNQVIDIKSVMQGITNDEAMIQSEIDIINSRRILEQVVADLKLTENPEFNPALGNPSILSRIKSLFVNENSNKEVLETLHYEKTIENVRTRMEVRMIPGSYTINLQFKSADPDLAAKIANRFVDVYLANQLDMKFEATERANDWLHSRLGEMRTELQQSEVAIQKFREDNNLFVQKGLTVSDQQLSELNSQLIIARADLAQSEAKLSQVRSLISSSKGVETSSEVLDSPLIQKLREQEAEILRKESDFSSRYGTKHPQMVNVRNELRDLRSKIKVEIDKIVASLSNSVDVSRARVKSLQNSLEEARGGVGKTSQAEVQLAELTRVNEANRNLYESFLNRFKELAEEQGLINNDTRVISYAAIPIEPNLMPQKLLVALALFGGIAVGITAAFIAEHLDRGVRSVEDLEKFIDGVQAIGMVPTLKKSGSSVEYISDNPTSYYAESIRSIRTAIAFSNPDNPPKVLLVTSSVPEEGKSSFACAMAKMLAMSGNKILLLDCDMRRPNVANLFNIKPKFFLSDILTRQTDEKEALLVDSKTPNLHMIASSANTPNSMELLSSKQMKDFVDNARNKYDMIILDTPPVLALADALALSEIADSTIFIARWEKTPREVIAQSMKKLEFVGAKLAGVVLSRVDMEKQKKYGYYSANSYYYGKYSKYYSKEG